MPTYLCLTEKKSFMWQSTVIYRQLGRSEGKVLENRDLGSRFVSVRTHLTVKVVCCLLPSAVLDVTISRRARRKFWVFELPAGVRADRPVPIPGELR